MAVAAPPELSRAEQKERRVKTGQHLKRLAFLSSDPPPDACAVGMRELETMGAEGLAVNVNAHNQAMCLCSGEPAVVERLFGELEARQIENEGSYAALARALTEAGELAKASAAVTLLRAPHPPRSALQRCSPAPHGRAGLRAVRVGRARRGGALWRQLERSASASAGRVRRDARDARARRRAAPAAAAPRRLCRHVAAADGGGRRARRRRSVVRRHVAAAYRGCAAALTRRRPAARSTISRPRAPRAPRPRAAD